MYILINNNIFHSIVNTITYFLCDTVCYFYYKLYVTGWPPRERLYIVLVEVSRPQFL